MKILITSSVDPMKSPHSRLHEFLRYLSKKHEITVLSINDWWRLEQTDINLYNKDFRDIFKKINILHLTDKRIPPVLQEIFSINSSNKLDGEFDVHLNYASFICGYSIAKKVHIPTIYDIADDWVEMTKNSPQIPSIFRPMGAHLLKTMVQKNITKSIRITYTTELLKNLYKIPNEKSILIPNGVDINLFKKYPSNECRKKLDISYQDFVIGYIGVLREWVDLDPVFAAVKRLSRKYRNLKLLVVGEEGGLKKNKEQAKRHGILDKVIFTGTVEYTQVPRYISCMDVCLIPFKLNAVSESSLPLKLFEYMACEKPVISTKIAGVVDAVQDRVLYASAEEEYRDKIAELYKDEELRTKLGIEGRNYVKENYEWSKLALKLENVLEEVRNR